MGHFRSALHLLSELPADLQHQRTERKLLLGLSPVLYAVKGYGCEEAERQSARIAVLNAQLGQDAKLFQTRWTQMVSTIACVSSRGMPQAALKLLVMAQDDPLKKMAGGCGILSAGVDGIKVAEALAKNLLTLPVPREVRQIYNFCLPAR